MLPRPRAADYTHGRTRPIIIMAMPGEPEHDTAATRARPVRSLLRWSLVRLVLGMRRMQRDWQVGDGREEAAARHVLERAAPGDLGAAIAAVDDYARRGKFLVNVGDEKGAILEGAVARAAPRLALELGAYVGYSALRIARALPPGGRLCSVELIPANAAIARRIVAHAGAADRVAIVDGALGDGGATMARLEAEHGVRAGGVDLVFIDHAKDQYLPDLQRILAAGWLHAGSVVVADNLRFPGSPRYRDYMAAAEGTRWRTRRHRAHVEYLPLIPDVVFESTLLTP
jgi:catechol O-methyltransferase